MTYKKNNNQKYNKFSSNSNKSFQQFISQPIGFENSNVLEPVMNTDGLFKLANFVESNKTEVGFPEVTVIPDLLRSVGKFVNERKRMKYAHQEFEKKLKFISDGVDKQYHVAMSRIESDTEIKLAQIKGNLQQSIMNINRYYDTEIQRIASAYKLKIKEMDLYYKNLEAQRKEQNKRFDKMMKLAMIDRKKASKAISEAEQVCQFYQTKMYAGTISKKGDEILYGFTQIKNKWCNYHRKYYSYVSIKNTLKRVIMNTLKNTLFDNIGMVIVAVIIIFLIIILFSSNKKKKHSIPKNHRNNTSYTIQDCKSTDDLQFKIDTYQKKLEIELEKNKELIQNAKRKGYIKASTAWTERFQELTNVSYTLNKNLEYENQRRLANDKFHRYTSLHFRSFIMSNIAYSDYIDSKKVRDEISNLLVAIGKGEVRVSPHDKKELYNIKDVCVKTTKCLYERMVSIQTKTGILRDKIRDECGKRGIEWYKKNINNKNK